MAVFYLLPLVCAVKFSLINQKGTYGPQNYTAIVNNGALSDALLLSLEIAAITAGIVVLLVFPTAVLVRLKLPKLTILMEAITILPIVVPPIVLAAGLLQMKETAPLWIVNAFFNHPLTILTPMYVVLAMPLMYRAIDTGLRAIDLHTLVDASRSLGASWPMTLWRVVLPNVQTAVLGGMFLTIALVLGEVVIANQLDQSYADLPAGDDPVRIAGQCAGNLGGDDAGGPDLHFPAPVQSFVPRAPSRGENRRGDLMTTESSSHAVDPQPAAPAPAPVTPPVSRVGVEFKDVRRHFGSVTALQGLDMEIHPGELVALLGPSGCGKTTALRLLAGFDRPDSGTITVGGRDVTKVPAHKRDMGMVFQAYSLFPNMSVRQNVAFGLRMRGPGEGGPADACRRAARDGGPRRRR